MTDDPKYLDYKLGYFRMPGAANGLADEVWTISETDSEFPDRRKTFLSFSTHNYDDAKERAFKVFAALVELGE